MILLNPIGGSNQQFAEANGLRDYNVAYEFATYFGSYLQAKGENVSMTRSTSEYPNALTLNSIINNTAPDVIFNIKAMYDLGSEPKGFLLECNAYSVLTGTISAELTKWAGKCVYPMGYKVTNSSTKAKITEITIGLGYISNADDAARMGSTGLDDIAKLIVTAAYGPPIKACQQVDPVYVPDPYLYDDSKWKEDSGNMGSDSGTIILDSIENISVHLLRIRTRGDHTVPYYWSTQDTIEDKNKVYKVIVSARSQSTKAKICLQAGSQSIQEQVTDSSWHRYTMTYDNTAGKLMIGTLGDTIVDFTAIWIAPEGQLGALDDPSKLYSLYPPGYRPVTTIDPTTSAYAPNTGVVTQANTLIGRAIDTGTNAVGTEALADVLNKVDSLALSPKALVGGVQGIINQITGGSLGALSVLDASSLLSSINYSGLQNMLKYSNRADKRLAMQKAINQLKSLETAAKQQQASAIKAGVSPQAAMQEAQRNLSKAQALGSVVQKRIQTVGQNLSQVDSIASETAANSSADAQAGIGVVGSVYTTVNKTNAQANIGAKTDALKKQEAAKAAALARAAAIDSKTRSSL